MRGGHNGAIIILDFHSSPVTTPLWRSITHLLPRRKESSMVKGNILIKASHSCNERSAFGGGFSVVAKRSAQYWKTPRSPSPLCKKITDECYQWSDRLVFAWTLLSPIFWYDQSYSGSPGRHLALCMGPESGNGESVSSAAKWWSDPGLHSCKLSH